MKRQYMRPAMQVVKLQHRQHILSGSLFGAKGLGSSSEDITWKEDGFTDSEDDM